MDFLKAVFNGGALTYEQFVEAVRAQKMNVVDLSKGGYVSEAKYNDKINALSQQVTDLSGQITQRDTDMTSLRSQLEAAQADASKLPGVQKSLSDLQTQYQTEHTNYENRIAQQQYEFAIREKASGLRFSSAAAKKAFLHEAISKGFKMDGETLLGYEDFVTKYKADDPGAFIAEKTEQDTPPDNPRLITKPGKDNSPNRLSLTEMMKKKNENPNMTVSFT